MCPLEFPFFGKTSQVLELFLGIAGTHSVLMAARLALRSCSVSHFSAGSEAAPAAPG